LGTVGLTEEARAREEAKKNTPLRKYALSEKNFNKCPKTLGGRANFAWLNKCIQVIEQGL